MRKFVTMLVLLVLVMGVGFAQAQDAPEAFCGTLSADDCQILINSQEAAANLTSADSTFAMNFAFMGIPDVPEISLAMDGSVAYTMDPTAMGAMDMGATMDMMADPEAYADYLASALGSFTGDIQLNITLPDLLVFLASSEGLDLPNVLPLNLRMVNGVAYVDFGSLAAVLPEDMSMGMPDGWVGIDLVGMISMMSEFASMDTESMGMETMDFDMSFIEEFTNPEFLNSFMTIERLPDGVATDGTPVAEFFFTFDFVSMMSSPAFQDIMTQSMEMSGAPISDEEMNEVMAMMEQIYADMNMTMTQSIGLTDFFVRGVNMDMNWDMTSMFAEMGETEGLENPTFLFNMTQSSGNFNNVAPIAAPEDATIIPLEAIFGEMG